MIDRMEAAARAATQGGDETQPCAGELRPAPDVCLRCGATANEMCRDNEGWRGDGRVSLNANQVLALIAELRDERARNAALVAHAERLREAAQPFVALLDPQQLRRICGLGADYDTDKLPDDLTRHAKLGDIRRLAAAMKVEP